MHSALNQTVLNNESSEAIVSRIYQEELTKLAQQAKVSGNLAEYQLYQVNIVLICQRIGSRPEMQTQHDDF